MKKVLKLARRISEVREEINKLGATEKRTEEQNKTLAEKRAESVKLEAEYRAALEAEEKRQEEMESDTRLVELRDKVKASEYVFRALDDQALTGAEAELNKELGLGNNQMPYAALLDPEEEKRQDVATSVDDDVFQRVRQPIMTRLFAGTEAASVGVEFPTAPRGIPSYPTLTGGVDGETVAEGAAIDAEAATFSVQTIDLTRAGARYKIRVEDIARMGELESTLRADMRSALAILLDNQVMVGDGTAPNVTGLLNSAHVTAAPADPSSNSDLDDFDTALAGLLNFTNAPARADVRLLIGLATYQFLLTSRHDNTARTFLELLESAGYGSIRPSRHIGVPTGANRIQLAYGFQRRNYRAVAPIWEGLELIRDPYTSAASGEINITAYMLFGFDVLRGSAQTRKFRLGAA